MTRKTGFSVIILWIYVSTAQAGSDNNWQFFNQKPPGAEPEIFAPGQISSELYDRDMAITPDGKSIYFCVSLGNYALIKIMVTKYIAGKWTSPEVAPFSSSPDYNDLEPCISPDGKKFYFCSTRPSPNGEDNHDIWVMSKEGSSWGEPKNLGAPINTDGEEFFPSLTRDGTIYFTRREKGERADHIYRAKSEKGFFTNVEKLGVEVNSGNSEFNGFIAPDESFIIVCVAGRKDSVGSIDYYVVFRNNDDAWTNPVNLGETINTPGFKEFSPYISPDGKYFFFMTTRAPDPKKLFSKKVTYNDFRKANAGPENGNPDIFWVDASFIEKLRPVN